MEPPDDDFLKKYSSPELDQAMAAVENVAALVGAFRKKLEQDGAPQELVAVLCIEMLRKIFGMQP